MEEFREYLDQEIRHLDYAPVAFVTAKDGRNVQVVLDMSQHLFKQANERVTTGRLNEALEQVMAERGPSTPHGKRVRVYYATQTDVAPPTIVVFVNKAEYLNESYQRFMINRFRDLLPYDEVPIRLVIRERQRQDRNAPEIGGDGRQHRPAAGRRPAAKGKPAPKRRPTPKPHPKAVRKGARRGTRPR
jgi:GTP-binding protein